MQGVHEPNLPMRPDDEIQIDCTAALRRGMAEWETVHNSGVPRLLLRAYLSHSQKYAILRLYIARVLGH